MFWMLCKYLYFDKLSGSELSSASAADSCCWKERIRGGSKPRIATSRSKSLVARPLLNIGSRRLLASKGVDNDSERVVRSAVRRIVNRNDILIFDKEKYPWMPHREPIFVVASYMIENQKETPKEKPKSTPTVTAIVIVAHSTSFYINF